MAGFQRNLMLGDRKHVHLNVGRNNTAFLNLLLLYAFATDKMYVLYKKRHNVYYTYMHVDFS